jgi:hypothetical protein
MHNPYLERYRRAREESYGRLGLPAPSAAGHGPDGGYDFRAESHFRSLRLSLIEEFAFSVPTRPAIEAIAERCPRVAEVGAGTGYWAWLLARAGVDVVTIERTPPRRQWFPATHRRRSALRHYPGHALFFCWPPYWNEMAARVLARHPDRDVVYAGEAANGCTGSASFHLALRHRYDLVTSVPLPGFLGLRDGLRIYRPRGPSA